MILLENIHLIPDTKARSFNRGRKATKAKMITTSLHKNQLSELFRLAEARRQDRIGGRSRGRGRGFRRSQRGVGGSNKDI